MQTLIQNHPIITSMIIITFSFGTAGLVVLWLAKDITRTSDKALEEHYKRNKK